MFMPAFGFCITKDQVGELTAWLNKSGDFAMIASDGQGRWRAVQPVTWTIGKRLCLWHTPDRPLPLLPADPRQKKGTVPDPLVRVGGIAFARSQPLATGIPRSQRSPTGQSVLRARPYGNLLAEFALATPSRPPPA